MKKTLLFSLAVFGGLLLQAQEKYALTTVDHKIGLSMLELFDEYISPLTYNGFGLKYENEKRAFFKPDNPFVSKYQRFDLLLGITENTPKTSDMVYIGMDYSWGAHYHFKPVRNLQILTGGLWDVGLGLKYNLRNVNNPFNMDVATNLNASVAFVYDLDLFKSKLPLRFLASFETPFMGVMYAPELGESYFEMFDIGTDSHLVHFSSFHNKQAFRQKYSIQISLKKSILSLNYNNGYNKYTGNDIVFKTKENTFSIGWTYSMRTFAGKRNTPPDNFVKY